MELKKYIEQAEKMAGSQKALAQLIGVSESHIRSAKSGARGLTNYACLIIAKILDEDEAKVIAASELVTEKKIERRSFWEKVLLAEKKAWEIADTDMAEIIRKIVPVKNKEKSISKK